MPNVIEIVLQLLHRVCITFPVRVVYLCPAGDSRFDQVPKMVKRDRLLVPFGALAPLRARTNQADVAFERVPKLRQLIESKFSQRPSDRRDTAVAFSRVDIFVCFLTAPHRSEFEKNEASPVATDPLLSEKDRPAVPDADEHGHANKERSANDQCYCRRNDIE